MSQPHSTYTPPQPTPAKSSLVYLALLCCALLCSALLSCTLLSCTLLSCALLCSTLLQFLPRCTGGTHGLSLLQRDVEEIIQNRAELPLTRYIPSLDYTVLISFAVSHVLSNSQFFVYQYVQFSVSKAGHDYVVNEL